MNFPTKKIIITLILFILTGCGATYKAKSGEPYPLFKNVQSLGTVVGVIVSEDLTESPATEISATNIATAFASTLKEKAVFKTVVYPYTEIAQVRPDIIISLTVNSVDDLNMAKNTGKAFVVGSSLGLLAPVLPSTYETKLGLEAKVQRLDKTTIGTYAYEDIYVFKEPNLWSNIDKVKEFRKESARHLVENVIEEMLKKRSDFVKIE